MTENNNLVTSTQGIIKEALHKLDKAEGDIKFMKPSGVPVRMPVQIDDGTVKTLAHRLPCAT